MGNTLSLGPYNKRLDKWVDIDEDKKMTAPRAARLGRASY